MPLFPLVKGWALRETGCGARTGAKWQHRLSLTLLGGHSRMPSETGGLLCRQRWRGRGKLPRGWRGSKTGPDARWGTTEQA
jgi:hypothetical protein